MKILACGVGMQSTALALMACEQAITGTSLYPDIPIYDAIIFCDLGLEPGRSEERRVGKECRL